MTKIQKTAVRYLLSLSAIHIAILVLLMSIDKSGSSEVFKIFFFVSISPWILCAIAGLPVSNPFVIASYMPFVQFNVIGILICVLTWLTIYGLLSWLISSRLAREK
jgi:hypothetical protein